MAITIKWDMARDSQAMVTASNGDRVVRAGFVEGLTNATTTPASAVIDAIASVSAGDIPQNYPDARITARLEYISFQGLTATTGRIWAGYATLANSQRIGTFAIEDITNLVNEPTMFDPISGNPLLVSLTSSAPVFGDATTKAVRMNYPANWRVLAIYGLFLTKPSSAIYNLRRKVNSIFWQGLPVGYWRNEGTRVRWDAASGLYAVSTSCVSRGDQPGEDWSTYEIAQKDGEYAKVDSSIMAPLIAADYAPGIQYKINGVLKVGPYRTANFNVALDSLINDTPLSSDNRIGVLIGA